MYITSSDIGFPRILRPVYPRTVSIPTLLLRLPVRAYGEANIPRNVIIKQRRFLLYMPNLYPVLRWSVRRDKVIIDIGTERKTIREIILTRHLLQISDSHQYRSLDHWSWLEKAKITYQLVPRISNTKIHQWTASVMSSLHKQKKKPIPVNDFLSKLLCQTDAHVSK